MGDPVGRRAAGGGRRAAGGQAVAGAPRAGNRHGRDPVPPLSTPVRRLGYKAELRCAGVVKLVDAPDSKSGSARSVGSIPTARTIRLAKRTNVIIRPVGPEDADALWAILEPVIRAGETYALPRDLDRAAALAYWTGSDRDNFVAEADGNIVGTYYLKANQAGGGAHVANCGYMTHAEAAGRGIARALCAHSLDHARRRSFRAMQFNLVVGTNERAIRLWRAMGFDVIGTLPGAFRHPVHGYVDALVMFQTL
jgi:ribosomal protein S18 acetylase RimI-like enzyme